MNLLEIKKAFVSISKIMTENKDYLIELDAQNGDGDLGLSMDTGFKAVSEYFNNAEETDIGKVFFNASKTLNEASPSSLGTILSFMLMGIAKKTKGKTSLPLDEMVSAMESGLNLIMDKAGSKPGEKTIIDSLYPAIQYLKESEIKEAKESFKLAAQKASEGSESTRAMRSVHGRAAYYGDKSIGVLDAGSVVGKLIFEAIFNSI